MHGHREAVASRARKSAGFCLLVALVCVLSLALQASLSLYSFKEDLPIEEEGVPSSNEELKALIRLVVSRYGAGFTKHDIKFTGAWNRKRLAEDLPMLEEAGFHIEPIHFYGAIPRISSINWQKLPKTLPGVHIDAEYLLSEVHRITTDECYKAFQQLPKSSKDASFSYEYHHSLGFTNPADAQFQFCLLLDVKPRRMIEIGSGVTTRLSAAALSLNAKITGHACNFTAIEPYPNRILRDGVPGLTTLLEKKVEDVPIEFFQELQAGDVLFIDSSHVLRLGNDVFFEYLHILPQLKEGIYVHVHDIFWPEHYTRGMYAQEGRFYTEQYLLQTFLSQNERWQLIYAGNLLNKQYHQRWLRAMRHDTQPPPRSILADAQRTSLNIGDALADTYRRSRSVTLWMVSKNS